MIEDLKQLCNTTTIKIRAKKLQLLTTRISEKKKRNTKITCTWLNSPGRLVSVIDMFVKSVAAYIK